MHREYVGVVGHGAWLAVLFSPISHASYEKMHMLSMKFLYQFPLPKINITFLRGGGRGMGGGREGTGVTSTSPKFDLFYVKHGYFVEGLL